MTDRARSDGAGTQWRAIRVLLAILGIAAALGATAHRLHFGVSFQDESCYIAEPMRFALGDRFFIDDLDVRQTSAALLVPIVWLYLAATGGSDGIMLFSRWLYLLYGIGIAAVAFSVLHRRMPWFGALATALMCAVYAPFNLFDLSYNSMGSLFLVAGILLAVAGVDESSGRRVHLALAGVAHALAAVSYPTFALVAAGYTALLAAWLPRPRWPGMLAFCLGATAVAAPLAVLLLQAGLEPLRETLAFTNAWGATYGSHHLGGAAKLAIVLYHIPEIGPTAAVGVALALLLVAAGRRAPGLAVVCAPLLALTPFLGLPRDNLSAMRFVIAFGLLAPVFAWSLRDRAFVRTLFVLGWVPSLAAGVIAAWSSTNGLINMAIGFLPAALISSVLIVLWASERAAASGRGPLREVALLTPVVAVAGLVYSQFAGAAVYRDAPLSELRHRIESGPFRGIRTSEADHALLSQLAADLPQVVNPNGKILFYPDFAAGHLMTSMRPATAYTWVGGVYPFHARWVTERGSPDDVIVRLKRRSMGIRRLDAAVLPGRRLAIDRPAYQIYTRAP